ncbi:hypothetical protein [Halorubrum sp. DTA46]|uniref:DUF7856 family protein n=1 Tax=Halorubrum sp. DTA46 TaxID=3402162 RepID=UPI003AAFB851
MRRSIDPPDAVDPSEAADRDERSTARCVDEPVVARPARVLARIPTGTSLRAELAAAARSRGRRSSLRAELVDLLDTLADITVEPVDLDAARRRVAEASGAEARLKERVAALRGDVRARRAVEAETDETLADLEAAAGELSDAQTDRIAAEQALEHARARAAEVRDQRERRLELRDRLQNRRRDARRELARDIYPSFRVALASVPGGDPSTAGSEPSAYDGEALAASLAAVKIADIEGPVTLDEAATARLDDWDGTVPAVVADAGTPADRTTIDGTAGRVGTAEDES